MSETATATGWYVFGIVEAGARVDGVELVRNGDLAAIVSQVDLAEFGHEALRERLNDRAWLEDTALRHADVLQRVAAEHAVVPLRFGTIYDERSDVTGLLETRGDDFRAALEHVRDRVELGVKVWIDRARFEHSLADAPEHEESAGRAYMLRKQNEQRAAAEAAERLAQLAQGLHAQLSALAVDAVANRPQPRELTGRDETMLLNAAYLVPRGDTRLEAGVAGLQAAYAELGVSFEITGPWPPHNFVDTRDGRP
jgi:Gas vesicle synthesis protein GvpL/GvpF